MYNVTAIEFDDSNRIYYFSNNELELTDKQIVVVET